MLPLEVNKVVQNAAADVSFSTKTGASGTFHAVTFHISKTLHPTNYDGISLGRYIRFPCYPVLWVQ